MRSWSLNAELRSSMPAIAASLQPNRVPARWRSKPTQNRTSVTPRYGGQRRWVRTVRRVIQGSVRAEAVRHGRETHRGPARPLRAYGRTYAEAAGIRLAGRPAPLYQ